MIPLFQYYRIAAAYLVLLMHQQFFVTGHLMSGFKNAAVPLFACIAGFLFSMGLSKKVVRILIPYAIWTVVYFVANNVILDVLIRKEDLNFPNWWVWLTGGTACHLWFLPSLFVAFALKNLLAKTVGASRLWTVYCIDGVILLLGVATQFIPSDSSAIWSGYCKMYFGRLLIYFALGGILKNALPRVPLKILPWIGLGFVILGVANFQFDWITLRSARPVLFVCGLMVIASSFKSVEIPNWLNGVAVETMGIYLVHSLIVAAMDYALSRFGYPVLPTVYAVPLTLAAFIVSYACARFMPKWMKG